MKTIFFKIFIPPVKVVIVLAIASFMIINGTKKIRQIENRSL